jgi:two-component system cell cycle sensor histidine kinase/response regulator CckA
MHPTDTNKQILLVEDEGLIAADIRRRLERLGYAVPAVAGTGEEALRLAAATPFDLVLMDVRLKGPLDGIATAHALQQDRQIPVVYVTAHADQETVDRATVTEPFGYILKPVTDGDLRSAVQVALYKHEMERRLRTSEAWLATTLRSVGEGILATDTSGQIVFMNPVAERLTGWSAADAHGLFLMDVLALLDEEGSAPASNPVFALPDGAAGCYTLVAPDGAATPVEIECFENRSADELLGAIVAIRDIRARKDLEARITQSQRMEAIAGIAGGLAHDFNNQLTVILGNASELCEQLSGESRDEALAIHQAASSAAALTAQLLVLSRRGIARPEVLNINEVIRDFQPAVSHILGPETKVVTNFAGPVGFIRCDRNQIRQMLLNLAIFSRDSMPLGGRFSIESSAVEFTDSSVPPPGCRPGAYVRLLISDTGKGFGKEALSRIFEPFAGTIAGAGGGLGLSIAHSIILQNGGAILAASEPGKGSSFEILLPCLGAFVESPAADTPTILLVEDESSVRRLIHKILEREGYQLLVAGSAEEAEALAAAYRDRIDLLIADVVMPGITGIELAERLRKLHPGVRVLFISGYRHDTLEYQGLLDRRLNLLTKPFPGSELLKRVRAAMASDPAGVL